MSIQEYFGLAGGLGVIISILFTGLQIRRNTKALRAAACHNVSMTFSNMWMKLAEASEMSKLLIRSGEEFDSLTRIERVRVRFGTKSYLRVYENAYFQSQIGILKDEDWDAIVLDTHHFFDRPCLPSIWTFIKDRSGKPFAAHGDKTMGINK